jgi:5'-deoxynucleotidase YfbR-like HD superfamily hydrolase
MNSDVYKQRDVLVDIGRFVLSFATVNRVTMHPDGVRYESDTDHTVMLSVVACALASKFYKDSLDIGLIAQFAIVHDLVEVHSSDTDTFGISEEGQKAKEMRESAAFSKIESEFARTYPWIPDMIREYELQSSIEARFVKTVDKMMTQITHVLNGGVYFTKRSIDEDSMQKDYATVIATAESSYGKEFPLLIELMKRLTEEARRATFG